MLRITRAGRFLAAAALALSAVTLFAVSPASAVPTGSLANNGTGGLVVTYSPSPGTAQDNVMLEIRLTTSTCGSGAPLAVLISDPTSPAGSQISGSPATIVAGSTAYAINASQPFTVASSTYLFCLFDGNTMNQLDSLTMTIGQAPPTTSTTIAPTTTAPADPATPAYTG